MTVPLVCDMSALDAAERDEHARLAGQLRGAVAGVNELPDGYAFVLPHAPGALRAAAAFVALERRCCPFLTFTLEVPTGLPTFVLATTGEGEIKPFLREEFGLGG